MNNVQADKIVPFSFHKCASKPIEAYLFIDPLCKDCWSINPFIMKLLLEYGHHFTLRHVLTGKVEAAPSPSHKWNKPANIRFVWEKTTSLHGFSCDGKINKHHSENLPYMSSLAIKAAELQGRAAGSKFLRKLQELIFFHNIIKPDANMLLSCAQKSGIDAEEFMKDLHSVSAKKAFQCDLKFTNEMHITEIPSLVFFHANSDEEGIKIAGIYSYDVYVQVLKEIVKQELCPSPLPSMETLLQEYDFISTRELAIIYNLSHAEAERELKKLLLKRMVKQIPTEKEIYWKYNRKENDPV
ncbi:MAG: ClpXP adapter SpxH family protein [Ectobacillus sp.]